MNKTLAGAVIAATITGGAWFTGDVDPTPTPEPTATVTVTPSDTPSPTGKPDKPTPTPTVTVTYTPPPVWTPPYTPPLVPAPNLIRVADLTGGGWRVARAVRNWNKNGRLRLVMVPACYNPDALPDDIPCIDVVVGHDPTGHGAWLDTIIPHRRYQVFLNADFLGKGHGYRKAGIRHFRRASVCHELGHVWFGMNHIEEGTGCMDLDVVESRRYASPELLRRLREMTVSAL